MKNFHIDGFGRVHIVEMVRGEPVVESILASLKKAGIKNAVVVSAVGSIQKLKYHRPTDLGQSAADEYLCVEGPMEVGSLTGSVIDGSGHFHIVASDTKNHYCGHLEEGTEVLYLLEVMLVELAGCNLERKATPENVNKLFEKE